MRALPQPRVIRIGPAEVFYFDDTHDRREWGWYVHEWGNEDDEPLGPFKTSEEALVGWLAQAEGKAVAHA